MNTYEVNPYNYQDQRIGLGGIGSGFGLLPGLGFGRLGFGLGRGFGFGLGRGFGFGLPFLTGIAAGSLLAPRPIYGPYPPYPPYPYPPFPYPQYPYY